MQKMIMVQGEPHPITLEILQSLPMKFYTERPKLNNPRPRHKLEIKNIFLSSYFACFKF